MCGAQRGARRLASASARKGETTQPLKSRSRITERWREPARSIKATEPAAPASNAPRAIAGRVMLRLPRAGDVRLAADDAAVLDDQPRGDDVAEQHAGGLNLDAIGGGDVALDGATHGHRTGVQIGLHTRSLAEPDFVLAHLDGALDLAVDANVLS